MVATVAVLAAVSCNKELSQEIPADEVVVFEASVDGAATKVSLDGKVSKWEAGDKITVHNGTTGYEFITASSGETAEFEYVGADFAGDKFMAVYPAGTYQADVQNKTVTAVIPTYQPSRENDFSVGSVPSVAYTEDNSLSFKNTPALLKFTVKGTDVKGLVFYGNNGEAVSGNIKVSLDEDNAVKSVEAQKTTITENDITETKLITWAKVWANTEDWCFNEGVTYYLSVVPQNFSKGFAVQLEVDGVGLVEVKKLETEYELKSNHIYDLGELEYVAPEVSESSWGVVGTMTDWKDKSDIPMTLEGEWYVARNITITTEDAFKFRTGGVWGTERTCEGPVAADTEVAVAAGAGDIKVAVAAIYDVYLSLAADKMKIVKVGDIEVEDPDEPVASAWGIVGDLTSWADNKDVTMFSYKGMYVAYNVNFPSDGSFKIRKDGKWNDAANYGLETSGDVEPGYYYSVITSGGSGNIKVKAGTYDIWFDLTNKRVYLLLPGTDPATVSEGTPSAPSNWNLVGSFNGWNPGDTTYAMSKQGDYYVYKGFTCASSVDMKFAPGSWGGDKGGSGATIAKDKKYSTGTSNIKVPAGTYDIYLKTDLSAFWFMTPGSVPAN